MLMYCTTYNSYEHIEYTPVLKRLNHFININILYKIQNISQNFILFLISFLFEYFSTLLMNILPQLVSL